MQRERDPRVVEEFRRRRKRRLGLAAFVSTGLGSVAWLAAAEELPVVPVDDYVRVHCDTTSAPAPSLPFADPEGTIDYWRFDRCEFPETPVRIEGVLGVRPGNCTQMACSPARPCCNGCTGRLFLRGSSYCVPFDLFQQLEGVTCQGTECGVQCKGVDVGERYVALGRMHREMSAKGPYYTFVVAHLARVESGDT